MLKSTPRLVVAALALAGALPAAAQQQPASNSVPMPSKPINPANFDVTANACQDFNRYANGGWSKTAAIPAAYSSWGSFNELADKNELVVRQIVEDASKNAKAPAGSNAQKIGTFYATCMDSAGAERAGYAPLKPVLAQIAAIRTSADLRDQLGALEKTAGLAPFSFGAGQDQKNSTEVIATAGQGGLGLPDRDYYTRSDAAATKLRAAYRDHLVKNFQLVGETEAMAGADADKVIGFEGKLAAASMTRVAMRDPNAVYHRMSVDSLQKLTPNIDWTRFRMQLGATGVTSVNVRQPDFLVALNGLMKSEPIDTWKAYMRAHAISGAAGVLSSPFVNEAFRYSQNLSGAKEQQPRWKRCAGATNAALGELVGQEYVAKTFTPEAKARALTMVNNLRDALADRIRGLDWMSDTTKQQALVKLTAFTRKIGYPDKWRDYSALKVRPGSFYDNVQAAGTWSRARNLAKIGKPVDRGEWGMTPPTVNAYYNPSMNEIVFPAGILQPPFYDPNADDAVNYGGMGAVIGHEMTHGFDDQGRQYDAQGNLRDWWTAQDAAAYKQRATLVSDQFDRYTVVDTMTHVNGKLTLGENIADLGGLTIAYAAYKKSLDGKAAPAPIDGLTADQRFFLSWAQVWRTLQRDEQTRLLVTVDPHSPAQWRVNGPLSNMPEFAAAFGCKEGDPMVRPMAQRAKIW